MATTIEIYNFLKTEIEKITGADISIAPKSHLFNDLGLDSLDIIEVMTETEIKFNIAVPDMEIENISTVESLVKLTELLIQTTNENV